MSPRPTTLVAADEDQVAFLATQLVALAETLELIPRSTESGVDRSQIENALDAFARVGVGRRSAGAAPLATPARLSRVLQSVLAAIEGSPMPDYEWRPLTQLLGDEAVAGLVGTSLSSVNRYRSGERETPDDVAVRLHTLALIAADLEGSYNDFGVRRWFQRRRSALDSASPEEILRADWSPEDERVKRVRALARALLSSPAT